MLSYQIELRFTILKLRSFIYVILIVLGIVWSGLLCVDVFVNQGFHSTDESVAIIILLSSQVATAIGLPITVLLGSSDSLNDSQWFSHVWFELLCLTLLLSYQFAGALVFSLLSSYFVCLGGADEQGACQLVNAYISICSWITPIILFCYCAYTMIRCFKLSTRYPKVWRTPFTLIPWNPNMLDLDFESKTSLSTLNKPRPGCLDEIKVPMSTSSSNPSARNSTQSRNSGNLSKFSTSNHSVRASMKSISTAAPNLSRFSQAPSSAKSNAELPFKYLSRVQSSYSQPRTSSNTHSPSSFKFPPSSDLSAWRDKDTHRQNQPPLKIPNSISISKHDSRLTFQQHVPLPPNPPLLAHTTLGPPIPLTLPSPQNKRISPYLPTYYYYPPSASTPRPGRLSTHLSVKPTPAGSASASRASLHPPSLYPYRNDLGTPRKYLNVT